MPHFLTDEECDHVIKLAQENGLETSGVVSELLPSLSDGNEEEVGEIFTHLDFNEDKFLSPSELADGLLDIAEGLLSDDDVKLVLAELKLDINNDEQLDFEEFKVSLSLVVTARHRVIPGFSTLCYWRPSFCLRTTFHY